MRSALDDFRQFIARGNLVDLAVAVVVAVAFTAVVKALVEDLITPLVAAIFGEPDFSGRPSLSTAASSVTASS